MRIFQSRISKIVSGGKRLPVSRCLNIYNKKAGVSTLSWERAESHFNENSSTGIIEALERPEIVPPPNGLRLWLDASDFSTVEVNDAGKVVGWRCKSTGVTARPVHAPPAWNVNGWLDFTKVGYLELPAGTFVPTAGISIVAKFTLRSVDPNNNQGIISSWGVANNDGSWELIQQKVSVIGGVVYGLVYLADGVNDVSLYATGAPNVSDGNWHIAAANWNATTRELWMDGTRILRTPLVSGTIRNAEETIKIGAVNDVHTSGWMDGRVSQIFVYDRPLVSDEVGEIMRQLA